MRIPRRTPPRVPLHDMTGRVCVVTGASSGIGLETAKGLAERGATVCVVGRDPRRIDAALGEIRSATGSERVESLRADFASLDQVRRLADEILARYPQLHVLVNNAGLWVQHCRLGEGGIETTFLVNHLAPFLLTNLLLDRLRASAPSRVVTVSSRLHIKERRLRFEDIRSERKYGGLAAYRQSKLANVLFSNELALRLDGSGVTSCAVHPGDVATDVVRDSRLLSVGLQWIGRLYLLTPEEGARTTLYAATSPELATQSGRYYADCADRLPSSEARDTAVAKRLWDESSRLVGLLDTRA